jgi:hypothetical protein
MGLPRRLDTSDNFDKGFIAFSRATISVSRSGFVS